MRKFLAFFITNPIWANAIIVVTALFGLISITTMRHSFFPETDPNRIVVSVSYVGASPEEMEEGVTTKIEECLTGIEGIEEITSNSLENFASITIEAYSGTAMDELLQEVKNAVDGISSLPAGSEEPQVVRIKSGGMSSTAAYLSLIGPNDLWKMKDMTQKIERELLNTPSISQVSTNGFPELEMVVEIDEIEMQKYGIRFDEIRNAIALNNLNLTAGSIKTNAEELYIRSMAKSTKAGAIGEITLRTTTDGQKILVRDVAKVTLKFSETPRKSYLNGKRSTTLVIQKLPSEDINKIAKEIDKYVKGFNVENEEYQLKTLFQFSDMLDERINMLSSNLIIGLVLVCIVLGLFLSVKLSLWVAFGIPFSFLGMFALGALYGMTINMISLFGMILVVGILVDDGIVIAENIYSHFERGKNPARAALDGTMEVISSVLTSVLTTVCAFGFLLFIGGHMEMMEEMAFAVIACLLVSLVEAFLVLPSHLASKHILGGAHQKSPKGLRKYLDTGINKVRKAYSNRLNKMTKRITWVVFYPLIFVLIIIGMTAAGIIRWTFFPSIPFDAIKIEAAYLPGESENRISEFLWHCDSIVEVVEQELIDEFSDTLITYRSLTVGSTENLGESGSHAGIVRVSLAETDKISANEIAQRIKSRIDSTKLAGVRKFTVGDQERFGSPLALSILGENSEQVQAAAEWVFDQIRVLPEVKDLVNNSGIGKREIHLRLKEKAQLLGLTRNEIVSQIRQAFLGSEAQRLIIGRDEVRVWIRYPKDGRKLIDQLEKMRIRTVAGGEYPVSELVDYSIDRGNVAIRHLNGEKRISLYGDLHNPENSGLVNAKINSDIIPTAKEKFPEASFKFGGQAQRAEDSAQRLGYAFAASIIFILIVLSLNFGSFYQARLILMVIPVGIASAMLGHYVVDRPFSILSFWGVIALVGILVNDAVVMLDMFNRNLRKGMTIVDAAVLAGEMRFRPIILTSITTVVGLMPLIMETNFQAQFLVPMGVSVAFGVLFGTMILVFYFPILIIFFNEMRIQRFWLWRGGKTAPNALEVEPIYKRQIREKELIEHSSKTT